MPIEDGRWQLIPVLEEATQRTTMLTLVSFSRDRIRRNISVSQALLAGREPAIRPRPPICVRRERGREEWTYGLELAGPAQVFYAVDRSPSVWLETRGRIVLIGRKRTCDNPSWRQEFTYLYVQLSRISGNKKRYRQRLPLLAPLTARSRCSSDGKWRSRCAMRVSIRGPSTIAYSLGRPRPGTGTGDAGVRLWIETRSSTEPGTEGWSSCVARSSLCLSQTSSLHSAEDA